MKGASAGIRSSRAMACKIRAAETIDPSAEDKVEHAMPRDTSQGAKQESCMICTFATNASLVTVPPISNTNTKYRTRDDAMAESVPSPMERAGSRKSPDILAPKKQKMRQRR